MMPKDCDDCDLLKDCSKRYQKAFKAKKIVCAEGKAHPTIESISDLESKLNEYT